jgi:hypothetical protein
MRLDTAFFGAAIDRENPLVFSKTSLLLTLSAFLFFEKYS